MNSLISPHSYPLILYISLSAAFVLNMVALAPVKSRQLIRNSGYGYSVYALVFVLLCTFFLGLRPIDPFFVDTVEYAKAYEVIGSKPSSYFLSGDILFRLGTLLLSSMGLSTHAYFLLIETIYISGFTYLAYRMFHRNMGIALIGLMSTFSFYAYGTNGIRNGLALSVMLVAVYIHYAQPGRWILAAILGLWALGTHISSALILAAYIASRQSRRSELFYCFWALCLLLSLFLGRTLEQLVIGTGVLGNWRSEEYLSGAYHDLKKFSVIGYRWDFLLYSLPPILWSWYWLKVRKFDESGYNLLVRLYLICNGVWLLAIQNFLSDRIAALSWMLQAFVLIYPLLKEPRVAYRKWLIAGVTVQNLVFSYIYKVL